MLLVVIYHSCAFWSGNWFTAVEVNQPAYGFQLFPIWLNSFHIYGFTMVSGFIYSYLQSQDQFGGHKERYSSIAVLLRSKFKRLLIPYIFVCAIWVVPITHYFYHYNASEIINKYVLGTGPSQLWFLLMLFNVFILAYLLESLYKRNIWIAAIVGILSFGVGVVGNKVIPNYYQIWTAFAYLPVFIVGYRVYRTDKRINPIYWVALHTATFAIMVSMPDEGLIMQAAHLGVEFLNHIFGALMAFSVLQWIAGRVQYGDNKLYKLFSRHSMTIYLFHQQIIYIVIWNLNGRVNSVMIAVINFFVAIVVATLISVVLSKWKATRFLIGEKV